MDAEQTLQLPLGLMPNLQQAELKVLAGWAETKLETFPVFAPWLRDTCHQETERRLAEGAIEIGSLSLPAMTATQLSDFLAGAYILSNLAVSQGIAIFADHLLKHAVSDAASVLAHYGDLPA